MKLYKVDVHVELAVLAESGERAEELVQKGCVDWIDELNQAQYKVSQVKDLSDLSTSWHDAVPLNCYDDRSCADLLPLTEEKLRAHRERLVRIAKAFRMTPPEDGHGLWLEYGLGKRWWLCGCADGDVVLPHTGPAARTEDEVLEVAEAWLAKKSSDERER